MSDSSSSSDDRDLQGPMDRLYPFFDGIDLSRGQTSSNSDESSISPATSSASETFPSDLSDGNESDVELEKEEIPEEAKGLEISEGQRYNIIPEPKEDLNESDPDDERIGIFEQAKVSKPQLDEGISPEKVFQSSQPIEIPEANFLAEPSHKGRRRPRWERELADLELSQTPADRRKRTLYLTHQERQEKKGK